MYIKYYMNCNTAMSHTAVMCEINAPRRHDVAILATYQAEESQWH